ncbi:MAG: YfhO family protein [Turicibacter sp.]|nr:YfhO family protein [Turicibacter sp.]
MRKMFRYTTLIFLIIFIKFILFGDFIYFLTGHYVNNYLSIYSNARELLSQQGIPQWSFNFFLGGNFLGAQNVYSMFNPFFLLTLLFPSSSLVKLYFPLLFLKTLLAAGALFLYMKETKWFKPHTMVIASVLYLFNGWYLSNLSEFVTIELLFFIPLVLYGVEKLVSSGRKRYLVAAFSLLLISHFTFTILCLGFLITYIMIRFYSVHQRDEMVFRKIIRQLLVAIALIIGINTAVILPLLLAFNAVSIELQEGMTYSSLLSLAMKGLFPLLHPTFTESINLFSTDVTVEGLYQSILVILMLPQVIKLLEKRVRNLVIASYGVVLFVVFMTQSLEIINITSLAPLNMNVISILLILFNTLMTAYVLNDIQLLDQQLLKKTCRIFSWLLFLVLGCVLSFELYIKYGSLSAWTLENIIGELIILSPYLMLYLVMILLVKIYYFILLQVGKKDQSLAINSTYLLLVLECIVASSLYFATNREYSVLVDDSVTDEGAITNQTNAVANYLKTIDPELYRIINSYEVQYNEPLYQGYNGFSIANPSLILSSQDVSWMLDEQVKESLSISAADYMLTTALSAKYYFTTDYECPLPGYQYIDRISGINIFKNHYFLPIGTSSPYYILESDFQKLNRMQKHYVFLKCIILSDEHLASSYGLEPFDLTELSEQPGEIQYFEAAQLRQNYGVSEVEYTQNTMTHHYVTPSPRLITYAIPYNKGWRAYANGKEVPIYEVNDGFIAVGLESGGEYEIQLTYSSPGFELGISLSTITFLIIGSHFCIKYHNRFKNCLKGI